MNSPRSSPRPVISLLHATRGRPDLALAAREKWISAATHPERIEHIFAVDCDDELTQQAVVGLLHRVVPAKGGGCVAAWNLAAEASTGDVLVQLSDDWAPVPGWDEEFVRRIRDVSQAAVLRPSDGHRRDDLLCMAILTRARFVQQGEFLHHGYLGVFSDDEFSFRAFLDGVVIDARDLVLTHHHPHYDDSVAQDETYANQNSAERSSTGRDTFLQRNPEAFGHWLHKGTWERFFVPLSATIPESVFAAAAPVAASPADSSDTASEKALRTAEDLFLSQNDHVELFRATTGQVEELLEGIKKSPLGRFALKKDQLLLFKRCHAGAKLRRKKRFMLQACQSYLQATRLGLRLLDQLSGSVLVKSKILTASLEGLHAQYQGQKEWLGKVKRWMEEMPEPQEPWGLDPAYYAQQADKYFSSRTLAARHYDKEGWQQGLNPHPLFDTRYFQTQNATQIDAEANPLEEYHRLLDEECAPEAHPKFPGAWSRDFFLHAFHRQKTSPAPIPEPPVNLAAAHEFAALKPVFVAIVVFAHASEADLRSFALAFVQASRQAADLNGSPVPLLLADLSGTLMEASLKQLSESTGVEMRLVPVSQSSGPSRASNEVMRVAFTSLRATHSVCLHPGGRLHPGALVELMAAVKDAGLPALVEARQFPHEDPKDYDAATLESNWSSARCLVIPRFLFELTGGFDDAFPMHGADIDLGWRTWQNGYRCLVAPSALVHYQLADTKNDAPSEKRLLESGRMLGIKWSTPLFRLQCEQSLIEHDHYRTIQDLPAFQPTLQHTPHGRVDFTHELAFAQPRW